MDTNLTAHYLAVQTARARLDTQAERGWLAKQAAEAQKRTHPLRWKVGAGLIHAGARLQGTAGPAFAAITANRVPAAAQDAS